ncbi:MAG: hypothetical protein ACOVOQ_03875 [Flavobacterium sp.]
MIKLKHILKEVEEEAPKCPVATQNVEVNLAHRQIAIDKYGYGPLNPNNPNIKFWKEKASIWKLDPDTQMDEVKSARCNSCSAFNITSRILDCIAKGLGSNSEEVAVKDTFQPKMEGEDVSAPEETDDTQGATQDAWDTIEAGKLGYCMMYKFKCAGSRTCNAWVTGGPIKDK